MGKAYKGKRKYKLYRGGNVAQTQVAVPSTPQTPQTVQGQPVQMGIIPQNNVPKTQLNTFPKKIRLNVTSDFKSTIEAPKEAEYILTQRKNSQQLYKLEDIYKPTFGKDETNDTPVDLYSSYVYERMKDLKLASCQELRNKGDKKIQKGFFIFKRDSSRRQQCTTDIKTLIKADNKILQNWINNFNQYGIKFLEHVQAKVEELGEKIKDLESQKKDKQVSLQDAIQTLEQNKSGIARESDQRLTEILRIITDKEDNMVKKIDSEINNFNTFLKEEIAVVSEIQSLDKQIETLDDQIKKTTQDQQKITNGLNKTNAQLQQQGINLEEMVKKIEDSISRYALMSGGKKRKYKRRPKKSAKKSKRKPKGKKSKKKGGTIKRSKPLSFKDLKSIQAIREVTKTKAERAKEEKERAKYEKEQALKHKMRKIRFGH